MPNPNVLRHSEPSLGRKVLVEAGKTVGTIAGMAIGGAIGAYVGAEFGLAFHSPHFQDFSWNPMSSPVNNLEIGTAIVTGGFGVLFGGPMGYLVARRVLR